MDYLSQHMRHTVCIVALISATAQAAGFYPSLHPPVGASAVAISAGTLFQASFDATGWSGDLAAYGIDPLSGRPVALLWRAAAQLTARDWHERLVVTRRDDTGEVVAFRALTDLSAEQQATLGDQATLDYLRGNPGEEGGRFRERYSPDGVTRNILGAFIHGNVLHVGDGEQARLYAGANDGMLHAFDAGDGHEVFAYVPGMIYRQLATLADGRGTAQPPCTMDGGLSAGTVRFRDGSLHTLLAGALGAGGQGLFALDISDPVVEDEAAALRRPLWEFSDRNDAALGYTFGTPQLALLNNDRRGALVGNGYGSEVADEHAGTGTAQLLIIDAESGTLLQRIDTGSGDASNPNGLSTPRAIDTDSDGHTDFVYAGDLQGNLWRFDLRDTNSADWHVSFNGAPLYSARDPSGQPQAITTMPAVIAHPDVGVRVLFGTGRLLSTVDLDPPGGAPVNSVYGIRDRFDDTLPDAGLTLTQTLTEYRYGDAQRARAGSRNSLEGDHDVWRVNLAEGERVVSDPLLDSGRLRVPVIQPTGEAREVWLLELDAQNGGAPERVVFDMNGDGAFDVRDDMIDNVTETRIAGLYYGDGPGSAPVSGNLSATRRVTYINRAEPDALISSPCGDAGCIASARSNPGRVAWKELLAE